MKGFKITNINFHQAVTLPAGTYTYSCKARPVFSSITFRVGITDYVISNLSPGVYQKGIKHTFTITSEQTNFYPARTVGDEIFEPQLEEGTNATTAGPNILDEPEALSRTGIQITTDMARIYAKKGDVDASISVEAGLIRQEVSDTNHRVSAVEQTVDSWSSTVTKAGEVVSQILQEDGTVKIKAKEYIELEGVVTANDNFKVLMDGSIEAKNGKFTGEISATSGYIGGLTIEDGKLYVGSINGNRIELDPYNRRIRLINNADQLMGQIVFASADSNRSSGSIIELNYLFQGVKRSSVRLGGFDSDVTMRTYNESGVEIGETNYRHDGMYVDGQKVDMGGGGGYTHPSTHPASMITTGTFAGIVKANNNTSYTTKQVRNMILSTGNAVSSQMANGDIWIKYE